MDDAHRKIYILHSLHSRHSLSIILKDKLTILECFQSQLILTVKQKIENAISDDVESLKTITDREERLEIRRSINTDYQLEANQIKAAAAPVGY